jgi:acetylornithine deacetylase/succinyl-diaminopimelate desuccinylase-like protein
MVIPFLCLLYDIVGRLPRDAPVGHAPSANGGYNDQEATQHHIEQQGAKHVDDALHKTVLAYAAASKEEELTLLRALGAIPAPTHHEERRARFVAQWLTEQGAANVEIDQANNVVCLLGDRSAPSLVAFAAHTDIVHEGIEPITLTEKDGRLYAPGIGDDTANLVGLMMATKYLLAHPEALPAHTGVLVVANSCEEGLGNLAGTRAVFERYGTRIRSFTSFDLYMPQCIDTAVGSHRFRITLKTQGGHSYHDFGRPNAIAELSSLICDLYDLPLPDDSVTINVGRIEGGTTVNSIAAEATALFEYRSTSEDALQAMRALLKKTVAAHRQAGIEILVDIIGVRPGNGPVDPVSQRDLTERPLDVIRSLTGVEPDRSPASTDANVPLSLGIPATTIGAVTGGLLHTDDEWIEIASLARGLAVILSCMLSDSATIR